MLRDSKDPRSIYRSGYCDGQEKYEPKQFHSNFPSAVNGYYWTCMNMTHIASGTVGFELRHDLWWSGRWGGLYVSDEFYIRSF